LRATARALRHHYKLLIARDGQEACDLLASGSHADVIISELELPEVDGPGLYSWLEANRPELCERFIVATAAQERDDYADFLEHHELTVLTKPLSYAQLLQAIEQLHRQALK
jgi:CheY-like chemotaxis protein